MSRKPTQTVSPLSFDARRIRSLGSQRSVLSLLPADGVPLRTAEVVHRGQAYGIPERTVYRYLRAAEKQGLVESKRFKGHVSWALSAEWRVPASMALAVSEVLGFPP